MIVDMSTKTIQWREARTFLAVGEPLIELSLDAQGALGVSFGGDMANFLVCLSKLLDLPAHSLRLMTALGGSVYSRWLREQLERHGIEIIGPERSGEPGIYGISPDPLAQPRSSYWRSHSAAHQFFSSVSRADLDAIATHADIVVLSGITLALCSEKSFEQLLQWAQELASRSMIALDCNFRPALWKSPEQARHRIDRLRDIAALMVTSLEDEEALWGDCSLTDTLERLTGAAPEVVMRTGKRGCWVLSEGHWNEATARPAGVIDATGAGDSHLAGYVAARMHGADPLQAAHFANAVARVIVTQRGSIPGAESVFPSLHSATFGEPSEVGLPASPEG
jgi:2-dehydro-3-deoxygluconokinase